MAKRAKPLMSLKHYEGRAAWDYGGLSEYFATTPTDIILRDNEISIEWPSVEGAAAQAVLQKNSGSKFVGRSTWARGTPYEDVAEVEAVLYSNELGHVLVGQETWRAGHTDWFIVQLVEPKPR